MTLRPVPLLLLVLSLIFAVACARAEPQPTGGGAASAASPPNGLLLALSQFEVSPEGKVLPKPKAALLEILVPRDGAWQVIPLEDPDSNVFHKAMVFDPGVGGPGILTLSGTKAALKLWRKGPRGLVAETLWQTDFGGKFSRMREAEVLTLEDGRPALVVATHDQGVVAIVSRDADGWKISEIDRKKNTFVHEIEVGDLNGDGVTEIYATPSEPNKFDGKPQRGEVVRYVLAPGSIEASRTVVADLGERHAKEILVDDVDGDGRDELYVAVEAVAGGQLEIRRYVDGTDPTAGVVIGRVQDRLCRFLTAGDVDGDGRREIVVATHKTGLWLLRPGAQPESRWQMSLIDRDSSGFEHAALLTDLDGDGVDELYVASDDQGEVRRYVWKEDRLVKEVLYRRPVPDAVFTWNLMPVPGDLVP